MGAVEQLIPAPLRQRKKAGRVMGHDHEPAGGGPLRRLAERRDEAGVLRADAGEIEAGEVDVPAAAGTVRALSRAAWWWRVLLGMGCRVVMSTHPLARRSLLSDLG